MNSAPLLASLRERSAGFWTDFSAALASAQSLADLLLLAGIYKKALRLGITQSPSSRSALRIAFIGAYTFTPLDEAVRVLLCSLGVTVDYFVGAYDNYVAEIRDSTSALYAFNPQLVLLFPSSHRCAYAGSIAESPDNVRSCAYQIAQDILELADMAHQRSGAEVILINFALPALTDPGPLRSKLAACPWTFKKLVNLELGLHAPSSVTICDAEFLSARIGTLCSSDARAWFETKQPGSPAFLHSLAHEIARLIVARRNPPKKVLVLDLDNTLWGGVLAEEGLRGIELGDTSPRGEAFKAFQHAIIRLKQRGVLLAVASKNDESLVHDAIERHPDMVLRKRDFVSIKANWGPKSDSIRAIAGELNLGLDSFVFVDDNPAEIEIVQQHVPEVTCIQLGDDPSMYVSQLLDARLFDPRAITSEDIVRTEHYQAESQRSATLSGATDMASYLASLQMVAEVRELNQLDLPRAAQLINKSNQFNLTTIRRSEAELAALVDEPDVRVITLRLADKFGDHGLVSVVVVKQHGATLEIDSWIMSCRVLQRNVEDLMLNQLVTLAEQLGCTTVAGSYIPTSKNALVKDLYARLGFKSISVNETITVWEKYTAGHRPEAISIALTTIPQWTKNK